MTRKPTPRPLGSSRDVHNPDRPEGMTSVVDSAATLLRAHLRRRSDDDPQFWDFSAVHGRSGGHRYFQYPAMMVPELQRALLEDLIEADPAVSVVYDPFMGSGTVMLESYYLGLSFVGSDINPMAVLLSQVKADPPPSHDAEVAGKRVLDRAGASSSRWTREFNHRDKWFAPKVSAGLSALHSAIADESDQRMRRFLWVCLAETVRFVSNSRSSTFKLHKYSDEVLAARKPDAIKQFSAVLDDNVDGIREHEASKHPAAGDVALFCADVLGDLPVEVLADAIMTSPPYGDNHTTVPYGQYSYLPLQWISTQDLVGEVDADAIARPGTLDTLSLGGRRYERARPVPAQVATDVPSLVAWLADRALSNGKTQKVVTFVDDYRRALHAADSRLRAEGFIFLTLGERRVAGADVPLVAFTREILEALGYSHVESISRLLPSRKRMAQRNAAGRTMAKETILVMQKSAVPSESSAAPR